MECCPSNACLMESTSVCRIFCASFFAWFGDGGQHVGGYSQVYVANAEAANCRRVLVDALGLDPRSSMGLCMQQLMLRMQSQEAKQDASS